MTSYSLLYHRSQTLVWSLKNINFVRQFFKFNLPIVALAANIDLNSKITINRFKARDCVKDDQNYFYTLIQTIFGERVYYIKIMQSLFVMACVDIKQDNCYVLYRDIIRCCTEYNNIIGDYDFSTLFKVVLLHELTSYSFK